MHRKRYHSGDRSELVRVFYKKIQTLRARIVSSDLLSSKSAFAQLKKLPKTWELFKWGGLCLSSKNDNFLDCKLRVC